MDNFKKGAAGNKYQALLLQKYAPPCLLVNQEEEILLVNGEVEKYLSVPDIMPGQLLSAIADKNIHQELLIGLKEVMQGEESVLIDGQTFSSKYTFYIHITPVMPKPAAEMLFLIEFEDIQAGNAVRTKLSETDLQSSFDELRRSAEHDVRNLVSNFVMLLKIEETHYATDNKIQDINKMQESFISNFNKHLNKLSTRFLNYFS